MDKSVDLTSGHTSSPHLHLRNLSELQIWHTYPLALGFRSNNSATTKRNKETIIVSACNNSILFPSYCVHLNIEIAIHPFIVTGWRIRPQVSMELFFCLKTTTSWFVLFLIGTLFHSKAFSNSPLHSSAKIISSQQGLSARQDKMHAGQRIGTHLVPLRALAQSAHLSWVSISSYKYLLYSSQAKDRPSCLKRTKV